MTIYDAAMAIVVVAGMIRGAWRGITWQLASIASLILGYLTAYPISAQLAPHFPGEPEVARALAMAVAYAAVSASVFALAWVVRETLHKLKFEAYDRHLGMLLGGLEAIGVGILLTLFVVSLAPTTRQPIFSSPTGRVVGTIMNTLGPVLPAELRQVLAPFWDAAAASSAALVTEAKAATPVPNHPTSSTAAATNSTLPEPAEPETAANPVASTAELPARPPLEAPPGNDAAVQPAGATSASSPPTRRDAFHGTASGMPSTLDRIIDKGRNEVERAVSETLDADPNQKAANLRQLVEKDKRRIKGAIADTLGKSKERVGNTVKERLSQGQRQVEQTMTDTIDNNLRRLEDLKPAPEQSPQ
jgi:uncharacterized membrane protein required for colicin V production